MHIPPAGRLALAWNHTRLNMTQRTDLDQLELEELAQAWNLRQQPELVLPGKDNPDPPAPHGRTLSTGSISVTSPSSGDEFCGTGTCVAGGGFCVDTTQR